MYLDHDCLGCSLFPNEQDSFALLHNGLHQEVSPYIVDIGYENGGIVRNCVFGVVILWHLMMTLQLKGTFKNNNLFMH